MELQETQHKKGFKETKLGWIPEDWEVKRLDEIGSFKNGINKSKEDFGFGHPFINLNDVFTPSLNIKNLSLVNATKNELKQYSLQTGDVLFVRSSVKAENVGVTKVISITLPETVYSGFIIRYRTNDELSTIFKNHCFDEEHFRYRLKSKSTVSANTNINQVALSSTLLIIPNVKEQKLIGELLNSWDTAITKLDSLIKAKQQLKKALMEQLLSGKKRLAGFSGEWEEKRVEDFASEYSEKNDSNEPIEVLSCTKYDGLVPSLQYFGRQVFGDDLSKYKIVPHGYFAYATNHIEEGSIGYQDFNKFGLVSPMYTVFKTKETIDDNYLFKVLKSHKLIHEYNRRMEGSIDRRGGLRWKNFKGIKINMPHIKEQIAIAQVLNTADQEIKLLTKQHKQLQLQKKGLMQQLLTGKKRLKV